MSLPSRPPRPHLAARALCALLALTVAAAAAYGIRWSLFGTAVAYAPAACGRGTCDGLEPLAVAGLVLFDLGLAVAAVSSLFGLHYAVTRRGARGFLLCCAAAGAFTAAGLRGLDQL